MSMWKSQVLMARAFLMEVVFHALKWILYECTYSCLFLKPLMGCEFHMWNLSILGTILQFKLPSGFFQTFWLDGKFKGLSKFQQAIAHKILILSSWVRTFIFSLLNEGMLSISKISPKLLETANFCQDVP